MSRKQEVREWIARIDYARQRFHNREFAALAHVAERLASELDELRTAREQREVTEREAQARTQAEAPRGYHQDLEFYGPYN